MGMMNWRRPLFSLAAKTGAIDALANFREVREFSRLTPKTLETERDENLRDLLLHAHDTVPYYNELLDEVGVVDGSSVDLSLFEELPMLTKDVLRAEGDRLRSTNPPAETYENTSGGTTGEPVEFVQDDRYWNWNVANKLYYHEMAGKPLGGREIKLWGDERDILDGSEDVRTRLRNFLYNRKTLNSFRMDESDMRGYVASINSFEPHTIWAYVESIHQLAQFVRRNGLAVHSPDGIVTTAGTLHESVREEIELAFGSTVYNQYGSRETGDMACECEAQEGLHVFSHSHYLEVVDDDGRPLPPGEEGYIAVTCLTNYSMPLIRYRIGDMGIMKERTCSCGRPFPLLESVTGRVTDHFVATDGSLVHGEYFTHLFYHKEPILKFQVRQESIDTVVVDLVVDDGAETGLEDDLVEITEAIRTVMGNEVTVDYQFRERIPPSSSGKYRYTISEVDFDA